MKTLTSVRAHIALLQAILMLIFASASAGAQEDTRILTIGDSITAGLARASNGVITCIPLGNIQLASIDQPLCKGGGQDGVGGFQPAMRAALNTPVLNYGNSSETTADIRARLQGALSQSQSSVVFLLAGTNDVIRDVPIDVSIGNLEAMISVITANENIAVVGTIPPLAGGRFATKEPDVILYNERVRNLEGALIADIHGALIGDWPINTSGDFVHLGPVGNAVVAETWISTLLAPPPEERVNTILPTILLLLDEAD